MGVNNPALLPLLVPISDLTPDPSNARLHDETNVSALVESLKSFDQVKPVVYWVDAEGRKVVKAGNGTVEAAKRLGWTHVAAVPFVGEAARATAYAIADNRTAELARWDMEVLPLQIAELKAWDEWSPEIVGFSDVLIEEMTPIEAAPIAAEKLKREKPERREPVAADVVAPATPSKISTSMGELLGVLSSMPSDARVEVERRSTCTVITIPHQ